MRSVFIALLLLLPAAYADAQLIGIVKDAKTGEALAYVNVGIPSKGVGTVTNEEGAFKLNISNNDADSLRVSMIGYLPQYFLIGDLKKHTDVIKLLPNDIQLKEVRITNHKYIEKVLGNTTKSKSVNAGFTSNDLGNEIGAIIKIKKSPTYLKRFNVAINENTNQDSSILRLNIYSVKNGLPDKNILNQNIFVIVKKGQDQIAFDLEPYHIMVDDNFFISLEWIKNSAGHGLKFSASLLGSGAIIAREASQAKWEKFGIAGLGFNVLAEY